MKKVVLAALIMGMILLFPQSAVEGARNAMAVWYRSVAPVLFPFFVLMPMLTSAEACKVYERFFSKIMKRIFKLPGSAAPAVLIAMLAGSPAGATAIAQLASAGRIQTNDARRMSISLCGLSPSFLILGIGQEMYGSLGLGWKMAGIQVAAQLMLLILTRKMECANMERREITESEARSGGIGKAVESILAICGYMVLFGAVSAVAGSLLDEKTGNLFLLVMDLPGGSARLSGLEIEGKLLLQCAAIGFGGMCIAYQNMDILQKAGIVWKDYLLGRGMAIVLFISMGAILIGGSDAAVQKGLESVRVNTYALSTFFACIGICPWIYSSRDIFLNKRYFEKKMENRCTNNNI